MRQNFIEHQEFNSQVQDIFRNVQQPVQSEYSFVEESKELIQFSGHICSEISTDQAEPYDEVVNTVEGDVQSETVVNSPVQSMTYLENELPNINNNFDDCYADEEIRTNNNCSLANVQSHTEDDNVQEEDCSYLNNFDDFVTDIVQNDNSDMYNQMTDVDPDQQENPDDQYVSDMMNNTYMDKLTEAENAENFLLQHWTSFDEL